MGHKQGIGKYKWADGNVYEGEWSENQINGFGTYVWEDGRKYFG